MVQGLADAKQHLRLAQEQQKKQYDKGRRDIVFQEGDKVLLSSKNITLRRIGDRTCTKKLMPKWIGPFPIEKAIGKGAYRLTLPPHMKMHNVFNVVNLRPYSTDNREQPPPPELVEGEEEFKVHSLASHRNAGRSYQYLVRWLGYGPEHNTWEPQSTLEDTEAFERYWASKGLEPPVLASSKQKIKACTAKVVYADQEATFQRIWPAHWCRAGSLWRAETGSPTAAAVHGSPPHAQEQEHTLTLLYRE
jgi:hypothetical protein